MSINTEIQRLNQAKEAIRQAIEAKGIQVPYFARLEDYSQYIEQIQPQPEPTGQPFDEIWIIPTDENTITINNIAYNQPQDASGNILSMESLTYDEERNIWILKLSGDLYHFAGDITSVSRGLFYNVTNADEVDFPDTLDNVPAYCFGNSTIGICTGGGLKVLGDRLFYNSTADIAALVVPESVTQLNCADGDYYGPFSYMSNLEELWFYSDEPPVLEEGKSMSNNFFMNTDNLTEIRVPDDSVDAYKEFFRGTGKENLVKGYGE